MTPLKEMIDTNDGGTAQNAADADADRPAGGAPVGPLDAPGRERASAALAVTRLSLSNFRCYAALRLDLTAAPVVLTGPNGAGKTNLLEALSFLSPGRGLRRARLSEVGRHGAVEPWAVAARLATPLGPRDIGTGLSAGGGEAGAERRIVRIDGEAVAGPSQLAALVAIAWLTPQMDRLFQDGAAGRRRFFDRLVLGLDPEHARSAAAYEKAMRERSRLFKGGGRPDARWLAALEEAMAAAGVAVAAARRETLVRLQAALVASDGPFPRADLALDGLVEGWLDAMPAVEAEDRLRARLRDNRSRDAEAGAATEGPHRSDMRVRHAAKDMPAELCSTGEQKALLIAIVLANVRLQAVRRGMVPLLLLDEVAAHLDAGRRAALFQAIADLGAQAWITGTDISLFSAMPANTQFLTVRDGRLVG